MDKIRETFNAIEKHAFLKYPGAENTQARLAYEVGMLRNMVMEVSRRDTAVDDILNFYNKQNSVLEKL